MSRDLNRAARNFDRLASSTRTPDGFRRGRRLVEELEPPIVDDTAGSPIFISATAPEIEAVSRWTLLAQATEAVETHALVTKFGFAPNSLIINVGTERPEAMGFEVLAVTLAACQAADVLANLAGSKEVAKVIQWTDELPKSLKGFGVDRLFRHAGALQARVAEIRAERSRPAPAPTALSLSKGSGHIRPRLTLPTRSHQKETSMQTSAARVIATAPKQAAANSAPTPRLVPSAPKPAPVATAPALLARIEADLVVADALASPGATQKLERALKLNSQKKAEKLVKETEDMLSRAAATPLPEPRPTRPAPAPRASRPVAPPPTCFGNGSPNTAARKAEQLAKKRARTAASICPKGSSNATPQGKGGGKKGGTQGKRGKGKK